MGATLAPYICLNFGQGWPWGCGGGHQPSKVFTFLLLTGYKTIFQYFPRNSSTYQQDLMSTNRVVRQMEVCTLPLPEYLSNI